MFHFFSFLLIFLLFFFNIPLIFSQCNEESFYSEFTFHRIISDDNCQEPSDIITGAFRSLAICSDTGVWRSNFDTFEQSPDQGNLLSDSRCIGGRSLGLIASNTSVTLFVASCYKSGVYLISSSNSPGIQNSSRLLVSAADCKNATSSAVTSTRLFLSCYGGDIVQIPLNNVFSALTVLGGSIRPNLAISAGFCRNSTKLIYSARRNILVAACLNGLFAFEISTINGLPVEPITPFLLATAAQCPSPLDIAYDIAGDQIFVTCTGVGIGIIKSSQDGSTILNYIIPAVSCYNPVSIAFDSFTSTVYAACDEQGILAWNGGRIFPMRNLYSCRNPTVVRVDSVTRDLIYGCQS